MPKILQLSRSGKKQHRTIKPGDMPKRQLAAECVFSTIADADAAVRELTQLGFAAAFMCGAEEELPMRWLLVWRRSTMDVLEFMALVTAIVEPYGSGADEANVVDDAALAEWLARLAGAKQAS